MLQPAQLIEHLTDAFERGTEACPAPGPRPSPNAFRCSPSRSNMSSRGPASLTVDAVEKYRLGAVKILEHLRPVIEREADLTLGEWAIGGTEPATLRLAA